MRTLHELQESARAAGLGPLLHPSTELVTVAGVRVVPNDPTELATAAELDLNTYALARMLASEGYPGPRAEAAAGFVAIAQCAVHKARRRGLDVAQLLLRSTVEEAAGHFGEQRGRWASTRQDPRRWHAEVAAEVLAGGPAEGDVAQGGEGFLHPSGMGDRLWSVLKRWHDGGAAWVGPSPHFTPSALVIVAPDASRTERDIAYRALRAALERAPGGAAGAAVGGAALVLALAAARMLGGA